MPLSASVIDFSTPFAASPASLPSTLRQRLRERHLPRAKHEPRLDVDGRCPLFDDLRVEHVLAVQLLRQLHEIGRIERRIGAIARGLERAC